MSSKIIRHISGIRSRLGRAAGAAWSEETPKEEGSPLDTLPNELLGAIVRTYFASAPGETTPAGFYGTGKAALSLVNKHFRSLCIPYLFRRVIIQKPKAAKAACLEKALQSLEGCEEILNSVE